MYFCFSVCAVFADTVDSLIQFPDQLKDAPEAFKQPRKDSYLERSRVTTQ